MNTRNYGVEFDAHDQELLSKKIATWQKVKGPRVGDYIKMLDGSLRRFTHHWGDSIQTTTEPSGAYGCSFFFGGDYMSFSGGLDKAIPIETIAATGETKDGLAWFFHHDHARAHNDVNCQVPCRVYRQNGGNHEDN